MRYIGNYNHNSEIGVLVEIDISSNDEKNNQYLTEISKNIAMHIAASKPKSISFFDLDEDFFNNEMSYGIKVSEKLQEPEKADKFNNYKRTIYKNYCLLYQPYVKDPDQTVEEYLNVESKKIGYTITVIKFVRYDANRT